jgi:DNA (cytosine-5)-methyltransferase 1
MQQKWNVLDLFSGGGGMSCGFHRHRDFRLIGAVDAQNGKPSSGKGSLECNKTYFKNIGIEPLLADIGNVTEEELRSYLMQTSGTSKVDVLISCAPCTGFSRTVRKNLVEDDPRNSLVLRSAEFVEMFNPSIFLMENVGELIKGKFSQYFEMLRARLVELGYIVRSEVHSLDDFGLPQSRRRALVVAVKAPLQVQTLRSFWEGYEFSSKAKTVRRAIAGFPTVRAGEAHSADPMHVSPNFSKRGMERLKLIPRDGGSWPDLLNVAGGRSLLIPSMETQLAKGRFGPYTDIYGRMAWDKPSVTLKRECGNTGNGRYCHPEQDRFCTVREMAVIQGFPRDYLFVAKSQSNMYRHIGDAVPPLISYQLASVCKWILTDSRPGIEEAILPLTHLTAMDVKVRPSVPIQLMLAEPAPAW